MMDDQELGKSGTVLTLFGVLSASIRARARICAYVYANTACLCVQPPGFKMTSK